MNKVAEYKVERRSLYANKNDRIPENILNVYQRKDGRLRFTIGSGKTMYVCSNAENHATRETFYLMSMKSGKTQRWEKI